MFLKPISWHGIEKQNLTQEKHTFTIKTNVLQHKRKKKLKPGLVASYNIKPGNEQNLFWFQCFINLSLTYLVRDLPTYLQPWTHMGLTDWKTGFQNDSFFQCFDTVGWGLSAVCEGIPQIHLENDS